jgi:hypothetical protein
MKEVFFILPLNMAIVMEALLHTKAASTGNLKSIISVHFVLSGFIEEVPNVSLWLLSKQCVL